MKPTPGDKFIHTDIIGRKQTVTYLGIRREVKGCEFEFFNDVNDDTVFFTDTEVAKMEKITTMKSYLVPVVYQMYGYVTIDANSIEDAIKKVEDGGDIPLPQDANYVEGSFEVDREGIDFAN